MKNNIMQARKLLIKRFSALHLNIFVPNIFNSRSHTEIDYDWLKLQFK